MTRIVYVNGRYLPYGAALVHAEDRGFQFGDGVYEVIEVYGGRLVDEARHLDRLQRSLNELGISYPMARGALAHVIRETVRRNRIAQGTVYLQITRGAAPRDFFIPDPALAPTIVCIARRLDRSRVEAMAARGIEVWTVPDIRWGRCDIKTVMLLPAVLAKDVARRKGARDAWLVDGQGNVTEGASANAWILTRDAQLITRPLGREILPGVTRSVVLEMISELGLTLIERAFRPEEAYQAVEAFNTAASATVMPVISVDGRQIGDGHPGPIAIKLRRAFHDKASLSERIAG